MNLYPSKSYRKYYYFYDCLPYYIKFIELQYEVFSYPHKALKPIKFILMTCIGLFTYHLQPSLAAQGFVTINFTGLNNTVDTTTQTVNGLNYTIRSWGGLFDSNADGLAIDHGSVNIAFNNSAVKIISFTLTQGMIDSLQRDENFTLQNAAGTSQTYDFGDLQAGTTTLNNQFQVGRSPNDGLVILSFNPSDAAIRLQSLQVQIVPEPQTYALLLGTLTFSWVCIRRRIYR